MGSLENKAKECHNFFVHNSSKGMVLGELKSFDSKCNKFIRMMKSNDSKSDDWVKALEMEKMIAELSLSGEILETTSYSYNEMLTKQLDAFRVEDIINDEIRERRYKRTSDASYIAELDALSKIVEKDIAFLKNGKNELTAMLAGVKNMEQGYTSVLKKINQENLGTQKWRNLAEEKFRPRINSFQFALYNVEEALEKIDNVETYYNFFYKKIMKEKEIVKDLLDIKNKKIDAEQFLDLR